MAPQKIGDSAFTLLETVIALAVIGTLLTIAIPSWQQYVARAHRAEAIRHILSAADCLGRTKAKKGSFDTNQCVPGPVENHYEFAIQPDGQTASDHYTITASPVGGNDRCGVLSLDHTGARKVSDPDAKASRCWGGR